MAYDDEDLFEEEYDFVDEDDESDVEEEEVDEVESDVEQEDPPKPKRRAARSTKAKRVEKKPAADKSETEEEVADSSNEPEGPPTDHLVHVYEFGKFKRTIQREFTEEDSIKFAEEYNRTSKSYGRHAVAAERDEEPEPHL